MDKKFKDMTLQEKFAFVLTVIIMSILLLGSVGGLFYLFSPKEHKTANADNSLTYEVTIPIIWQFDNDRISQGLIISGNGSLLLDYGTISNGSFVRTMQSLNVGSSYTLSFATDTNTTLDLFLTVGQNGEFTSFNYLTLLYYNSFQGNNGYVRITLYDNIGNTIVLSFYKYPLGSSYTFDDQYNNGNDRRYSTISSLDSLINSGITDGYNSGYNVGFNDGYNSGLELGKDIGYHQGASDSEQFTFSKLLDAVFYAPIKAFTSIFNFDFLGVNLLSIVSFILTVCVVVGLLKWLV